MITRIHKNITKKIMQKSIKGFTNKFCIIIDHMRILPISLLTCCVISDMVFGTDYLIKTDPNNFYNYIEIKKFSSPKIKIWFEPIFFTL